MDFFPLDVDDDWWLKFFQWLSIVAVAISLVAAYCSNILSDRVTKRMQGEIANSNKMAAKSNEIAATTNERAEELKADNLKLGIRLEEEKLARLEIERQLADRFLSPNFCSISWRVAASD